MRYRSLFTAMAVVMVAVACARTGRVGMPPPVRPGVLAPNDARTTFLGLSSLMESRGIPVLMADTSFGVLRTEWVQWGPGEIDLDDMADCGGGPDSPPSRTRARFGFEVRPRANRSFVTIISHWQIEMHGGFDDSDRGYVDCVSTGEWERAMEQMITQRQAIR